MRVCLDAGHYGLYNRSPVIPDYYESNMTWQLTQLLDAALTRRGVTVIQTRKEQSKDLSLIRRGQLSRGCDLFVSIHSNAAGSEIVDHPIAYVRRADPPSAEIGLQLAQTVERVMRTKHKARINTRASSNDRDGNGKMDDEYYGVLQGAKMVGTHAIILEHSFHTNTRATRWLMDIGNLRMLAEAEADVIAAWGKGEEVDDMTYEEFKAYMVRWESEKAAQDATWDAAVMAKAKAAEVMDGLRAKSNITRGEVAMILDNLDLI